MGRAAQGTVTIRPKVEHDGNGSTQYPGEDGFQKQQRVVRRRIMVVSNPDPNTDSEGEVEPVKNIECVSVLAACSHVGCRDSIVDTGLFLPSRSSTWGQGETDATRLCYRDSPQL